MNAGRLDRFPTFVKWLSLLILIALSVGCARTLRFKVIDAASNRPVEGVEVQWWTQHYYLPLTSRTNLLVAGYADEGGVIAIQGVKRRNRNNTFIFSKHDYQEAVAVIERTTNAISVLSPRTTNTTERIWVEQGLGGPDAEIIIPLHAR
jgi:hypothetical protein